METLAPYCSVLRHHSIDLTEQATHDSCHDDSSTLDHAWCATGFACPDRVVLNILPTVITSIIALY